MVSSSTVQGQDIMMWLSALAVSSAAFAPEPKTNADLAFVACGAFVLTG